MGWLGTWRAQQSVKLPTKSVEVRLLLIPPKLSLLVLKLTGIIFFVSCTTELVVFDPSKDTRTAGYPLKIMYPWLIGGKSKTKKYVKDEIKYMAPVCGQCR